MVEFDTAPSTMIAIKKAMARKPRTMPARASPSPPWRPWDSRIWLRATKPRTMATTEPTPQGTQPTRPRTNDAIARPFVAGGWKPGGG